MSSPGIIETHKGDKRNALRDSQGQFTEDPVSVGEALAADRRTRAKTTVPEGQGGCSNEERN